MKSVLNLLIFSLLLVYGVAVFTISASKKVSDMTSRNYSVNDEMKPFQATIELDHALPIVINTWPFVEAGQKALDILLHGGSALDAIELGCSLCEELQCDGTVGYGGSPDENGETTLDAMIMDGDTHRIGAVGALRRVKKAIAVARRVMEHTDHTMLVGSQATAFAIAMGFEEQDLSSSKSEAIYKLWKKNNCQPNFWRNVVPDPRTSCGPYRPISNAHEWNISVSGIKKSAFGPRNHDTIGMIAVDSMGRIAGGTSTNGAVHKIPGRIGDSPIPGSGVYVDKQIGGATATGDGDVMMRFMPSLIAVESMRGGLSPSEAAMTALNRIAEYEPRFSGAIVALSMKGEFGAACNNLPDGIFNFTVGSGFEGVSVQFVTCLDVVTFSESYLAK